MSRFSRPVVAAFAGLSAGVDRVALREAIVALVQIAVDRFDLVVAADPASVALATAAARSLDWERALYIVDGGEDAHARSVTWDALHEVPLRGAFLLGSPPRIQVQLRGPVYPVFSVGGSLEMNSSRWDGNWRQFEEELRRDHVYGALFYRILGEIDLTPTRGSEPAPQVPPLLLLGALLAQAIDPRLSSPRAWERLMVGLRQVVGPLHAAAWIPEDAILCVLVSGDGFAAHHLGRAWLYTVGTGRFPERGLLRSQEHVVLHDPGGWFAVPDREATAQDLAREADFGLRLIEELRSGERRNGDLVDFVRSFRALEARAGTSFLRDVPPEAAGSLVHTLERALQKCLVPQHGRVPPQPSRVEDAQPGPVPPDPAPAPDLRGRWRTLEG